mgnify:CR=1 FL=1
MNQHVDMLRGEVSLYLQSMGLRPSTKGYQYLCFALIQLLQGTPFQNTIWAVTAIHFDQALHNVLRCVRREIKHAFVENPERFADNQESSTPTEPPKNAEFLRLAQAMLTARYLI